MEILNEFGINPVLLAAQVVNFLILLWILNRFLYGPILRVLKSRKQTIEDSLKNAEEIDKRVIQTEQDREKILEEASREAQKLLDETKKEIALMKAEGRMDAKKQVDMIIEKTQEEMRAEKDKMMGEVRGAAVDLVALTLEKITEGIVSKENQKRIVERRMRNLS